MKFSLLRIALLMVLALFAFGCNGKKVAVVNTDMVYQKSTASEKGTEYLKSVAAELDSELRSAEAEAEKAKDKKAAQAEMQQAFMAAQQRFNAEQQQVVAAMGEALRKALDTCRTKLRLEVIISTEQAISHDPAVDITQQVINELNAMSIEFKPVTAEAPADPSADPSADAPAGTPAQ